MTAFRATFSDMKLVKTRQVAQLIFEIPIEDFDAAYEVLGGMPVPSKERWFGIAAIKLPTPQTEKEPETSPIRTPARSQSDQPPAETKRNWRDVQPAAQAGIRGGEPEFRAFLREVKNYNLCATPEDAATAVRDLCGVSSRVELGTKHAARVLWHQVDTEYQAWLARERVGA